MIATTGSGERSPLMIIEELVQDRARALGLDLAVAGGHNRLREIVQSEIANWRLAYQQGHRSHDIIDPEDPRRRSDRSRSGP